MTWERFRRLPLVGQVALFAVAALLVYEFVSVLASPLGGGGTGGGRSSFSARPDGLGAWADLLASAGHDVTRARQSVTGVDLPDDATVVVPGRHLSNREIADLELFLIRGGRLVVAGSQATRTVEELLDTEVEFAGVGVGLAVPIVPVPETSGVQEFRPVDQGIWTDTGGALPVMTAGDQAVVAVADVGQGRLVMIADLTPLENQWIGESDNAAFALASAGPPERPVVFAEAGSAGGEGSGLSAVPDQWRWALIAGGVATLLAMWSSARRFGPPEDEARDLPPPRRAYVDAMATTLLRTKRPASSIEPLQRAARERLVRRAALAPDAADEHLRAAAVDLGLAPDEIEALFGPVTDNDKAMAVGRAMARLGGTRW